MGKKKETCFPSYHKEHVSSGYLSDLSDILAVKSPTGHLAYAGLIAGEHRA